jgi:hypothetical protein
MRERGGKRTCRAGESLESLYRAVSCLPAALKLADGRALSSTYQDNESLNGPTHLPGRGATMLTPDRCGIERPGELVVSQVDTVQISMRNGLEAGGYGDPYAVSTMISCMGRAVEG